MELQKIIKALKCQTWLSFIAFIKPARLIYTNEDFLKFAEVVVLRHFNVYNNNWLTYSTLTDAAGLEAETFTISYDHTQLDEEHTRIPNNGNHHRNIPELFDSCLSRTIPTKYTVSGKCRITRLPFGKSYVTFSWRRYVSDPSSLRRISFEHSQVNPKKDKRY